MISSEGINKAVPCNVRTLPTMRKPNSINAVPVNAVPNTWNVKICRMNLSWPMIIYRDTYIKDTI